MANEKFKVKFGLAVGDTVATIDGTTGNIVTSGDIQVNGGNILGPGGASDLIIENASTIQMKNDFTLFSTDAGVTKAYFNNLGGKFTFNGSDADNTGNYNLYSHGTFGTLGNATLGGDIDVKGGDITNSTGALQIATASNGAITLAPNGTGSVALTLANGGNLTNTRNYVFGAIRQATTASNGDIWGFGSAGTNNPSRGVSIDNTGNTAKRNAVVMRGYNNQRSSIIGEMASGSAATPAVPGVGFTIVEMAATGYNGGGADGWVSSQNNGYVGRALFQTSETWTSTSTGTNFVVGVNPTGYVGLFPNVLTLNPVNGQTNIDTFTFANKLPVVGGNGATQMTVTQALVSTAGDIQVGGNDIKNSAGLNSYSMTSDLSQTTINSLATTVQDPNATSLTGTNNVLMEFGPTKSVYTMYGVSTNGSVIPSVNYNGYRRVAGNNVATLNNDILGQFKFNGNTNTGTGGPSSPGPAGTIKVFATENWTNTQTGSGIGIETCRTGTTTSYNIISGNTNSLAFNSDTVNINSFDSTVNRVSVNGSAATINLPVNLYEIGGSTPLYGNKISYNRIYGQWQYDATITPLAANTAYAFQWQGGSAITDYANIATATNTSRIQPNATGFYNLQFSIQLENTSNAADHTAYIWWRKNGTDIPGSMGRVYVTKQHQTIAGWNNVVQATASTDYFELMYAVDNVALIFPYFAATAFGPSTAAAFISLVPVGA